MSVSSSFSFLKLCTMVTSKVPCLPGARTGDIPEGDGSVLASASPPGSGQVQTNWKSLL